jgi:lipopolysaccharide transport system ATP-binding protein
LAKMQDVAGRGRTVLFVSHNMTTVQSLCERVIRFVDGEIKGDGDPKEEIQSYLSSSIIGQAEPKRLNLGGAINIVNMSLLPNPVETGNDLSFELDLMANCPLRLSEAAFILYAVEGPRVGIVDLRPAGFPFLMKAGECLRIEGVVKSIPLVERQYRVGLWIDSGPFVGELKDLVDLTVAPAMAKNTYAPVGPQYRGWVEFKTECFSRPISGAVPDQPSRVVGAGATS